MLVCILTHTQIRKNITNEVQHKCMETNTNTDLYTQIQINICRCMQNYVKPYFVDLPFRAHLGYGYTSHAGAMQVLYTFECRLGEFWIPKRKQNDTKVSQGIFKNSTWGTRSKKQGKGGNSIAGSGEPFSIFVHKTQLRTMIKKRKHTKNKDL